MESEARSIRLAILVTHEVRELSVFAVNLSATVATPEENRRFSFPTIFPFTTKE